jgi:hypothetical protein
MTYTGLFIIITALVLAVNKNVVVGPDWDAKVWLTVTLLYYILEFIMQMMQYHCVKKEMRENLCIMASRYIGMLFLVGWLVYGNTIYYKNISSNTAAITNSGLQWVMFFLLVFGYFEMIKCCCISTIVCIMIPFVFFAYRRAARPNWVPAPPKFMEKLVKDKFNPEHN